MRTIVLTGGGTAGHCIPNIALLPYLKNNFDRICYIGTKDGIEKRIVEREDLPYYGVTSAKLVRKFTVKNFSILFRVVKGYRECKAILKELDPAIVFSKGGYAAFPVVLAAHKLGIPVIAHESDFSVGLANRMAARYAALTLTGFPETALSLKNGRYIGSPIRKTLLTGERERALDRYGFSGKKPVLLVIGGSQGSTAINGTLRAALPKLLPQFDILHLTGKGNADAQLSTEGYCQVEFTDDMADVFGIADAAVSRAGANAIAELLALKIPTVLIPLPKGNSRGDQVENAEYYAKKGLVTVLPQENLTPESLESAVAACYADRFNFRRRLEETPVRDASRQITKLLSDYAKR